MTWLLDLTVELQVSLSHTFDSALFKKACQNDFLNFKQIKNVYAKYYQCPFKDDKWKIKGRRIFA